jgi:hypothetical protein
MFLTKHVPGLKRTKGTFKHWTQTNKMVDRVGSIFVFPKLAVCREAFEKMMHQECGWNDQQEWTGEPPPDADNAVNDPDEADAEPSERPRKELF